VKKVVALTTLMGWFGFASAHGAEGRRTHFLTDGPASVGGTLGGAMTGFPEDAAAVYWNPAGLAGQQSSVLIDHAKTNEETSTSWLGLAAGSPLLKFGMNWKHEELPLDSGKDAILLGLGFDQSVIPWIPRVPGLSFGTTLGRVSEDIAGASASSYLVDVGALWKSAPGPWQLGLGGAIKNLYFSGLKFEGGSEKEVWPRELRGGIAVSRWGLTGLINGTAVDSDFQTSFGADYTLGKYIHLRAGYDDDIRFGVGVTLKNLSLAFGYQNGEVQNVPSASLSYVWGAKEEVDYTNPLAELEARHRNLEAYLLAEVRSDIQSSKKLDLQKILRLLAVAPQNDDAWVLLQSLTGEPRFSAKIPRSNRSRRDYLAFAVAFANGDEAAPSNAQLFLKKYPRSRASKIIQLIGKHDPTLQLTPKEEKK